MRIPVVIFIIGLVIFIGGIVLAVAMPATATWKPDKEILASEKSLAVSAGWKSKSEVLADGESLSTSPLWKSESDNSIDEIITVNWYETYDYALDFTPYIYKEAKDFVITGDAIEQSSPQLWFNFYVFDSVNFDLWKAGASYTAYYEAEGKTSVSFSFSIATKDEVPSTFYFVVEEYVVGAKPVVHVAAKIDWIEKSSRYDYTEYHSSLGLFLIEEGKDFTLQGTATEVGNNKFNFYIFDSYSEYSNWYDGKTYSAIYEAKDAITESFSISLIKDQATSSIYFAVENPNLDVDETVTLSASIDYVEKTSIYDCSEYFMSWEIILTIEEAKDFMLEGTATEVDDNKFNFYIFDTTNYFNWIGDEPYTSYYEVKNVTTTSFSIPLTKDEATSIFYFVVENPLQDTNETVKLSATTKWNEKATIATTALGIVLGGVVVLFGLIIMIIAGVASLVFKPKPPAPPTPPTQYQPAILQDFYWLA